MNPETISKIIISSVWIYFFYHVVTSTFTMYRDFYNKRRFSTESPLEIIKRNGFEGEGHHVITDDGYILAMHRILGKKEAGKTGNLPPVILQHGLLSSSMDFLVLEADSSLAFLLSKLGYDVWMGNARGNTYSRRHQTLDPKHKAYWNFTWHESGIYDLAAQIDYVLNKTGQEKVVYIAHSMGTTMFFVLTSIFPEYNDKVELAMLMAPVAYLSSVKSPLIRMLAAYGKELEELEQLISKGEFLREGTLMDYLIQKLCRTRFIQYKYCRSVVFMIAGADPEEFDDNLLDIFLKSFPAGYSSKGVAHYAQIMNSGKFRQYDYGEEKNLIKYGSQYPPVYNLTNIRAPIYTYEGKNDLLATPSDINSLSFNLTSLKERYTVEYIYFNHLDFLISKNVKKQLYNTLLKNLNEFLKGEGNN